MWHCWQRSHTSTKLDYAGYCLSLATPIVSWKRQKRWSALLLVKMHEGWSCPAKLSFLIQAHRVPEIHLKWTKLAQDLANWLVHLVPAPILRIPWQAEICRVLVPVPNMHASHRQIQLHQPLASGVWHVTVVEIAIDRGNHRQGLGI